MVKLIEISRSFRAMNTNVLAVVSLPEKRVVEGQARLDKIQAIFGTNEKVLSRFRDDSELSALNLSAGQPFKASALLFRVVKASLEAARLSEGFFDPTILPYLQAAGYDRSFEKIDGSSHVNPTTPPDNRCDYTTIELDASQSTVLLPEGCSLDLGGIGKGWTVDRCCRGLDSYPGFVIDAGGDIRLWGTQSNGSPWSVGVADPFKNDRDIITLELDRGAICTSTTAVRKWRSGSLWQHHLIDSRTGSPSTSGVVSATVIADSATRAEVLAKTSLLMGAEHGLDFVQRQEHASIMLVLENEEVLYSTGFPEVLNVA